MVLLSRYRMPRHAGFGLVLAKTGYAKVTRRYEGETMSGFVSYEVQGPVGVITLNNPPVNALSVNKGVMQSMLALLDGIEHRLHDALVNR